jgi:hypothetical protein
MSWFGAATAVGDAIALIVLDSAGLAVEIVDLEGSRRHRLPLAVSPGAALYASIFDVAASPDGDHLAAAWVENDDTAVIQLHRRQCVARR